MGTHVIHKSVCNTWTPMWELRVVLLEYILVVSTTVHP